MNSLQDIEGITMKNHCNTHNYMSHIKLYCYCCYIDNQYSQVGKEGMIMKNHCNIHNYMSRTKFGYCYNHTQYSQMDKASMHRYNIHLYHMRNVFQNSKYICMGYNLLDNIFAYYLYYIQYHMSNTYKYLNMLYNDLCYYNNNKYDLLLLQ